jgi:phosphohistidine phosphatase
MDLILWRHADAEPGAPDSERRLTAKGSKQANQMAKWLRARLPQDVTVLASPAQRAEETAKPLGLDYRTDPAIGTGTTPEALIGATGWPEAAGTVLVVGHQPTLGEVASLLVTGSATEWSIKKGAIWWLEHRGGEARVRAVMSPDLLG